MTYRDPIAEAMRQRDADHFERNGATMAANVTRGTPDIEALRADVRRTQLALQACALDVGAAGLWDGDTASAEREELEARAEHEAACAALDHELWWRAVLADPRA